VPLGSQEVPLLDGRAAVPADRAAVRERLQVSVRGSSEATSTWKGWAEMADIYKFSDRVIDMGERLADVADAVQGKGYRKGRSGLRWLILPAAGAGLFALGASSSFTRQAKSVFNQAKERASDLPEDLVGRVQQATSTTPSTQKKTSASRTGSQRRKTGSAAR
jgi:hypothetical protein